MSKAAVFTMKLEPDLRAAFMAAAEASHRPASQVVRELMRGYIEREAARQEQGDFLARKVAAARTASNAGVGRSNDAVEADFAARRAALK
ncbi:antitoxin of toxin-antitoxin stability system [Sphingomonas panni]|uniref:antitoxin of toxin-antitoxin stability system n=1 Tax=Sphingomonas panni TaxID=237612 RepID=UPI001F5BDD07|nr:antitoxin of toxin-antitoxin stability system [Sphingomonas panni]